MRWSVKHRTIAEGDTRIVKRFLFLPLEIGGEVRWLEIARYKQKFMKPFRNTSGHWKNLYWEI
jgi:hypothetical protein